MGSLQGGMGVCPTVGFAGHQVASLAGSVSERRRDAPTTLGFGALGQWGGEECMLWALQFAFFVLAR